MRRNSLANTFLGLLLLLTAACRVDLAKVASPAVFRLTQDTTLFLQAGNSATFPVAGGVPPYTATTSGGLADLGVSDGKVVAGSLLGQSEISVSDTLGATVKFTVQVYAPLSLATTLNFTSLTSGSAAFSGGVGPYTLSSPRFTAAGTTLSFNAGWANEARTTQLALTDAVGNVRNAALTVNAQALRFGTTSDDEGLNVYSSASGFIVGGSTLGDLTADAPGGGADIYLAWYNAAGIRQFQKELGSSAADSARKMIIDEAHDAVWTVGSTSGAFAGAGLGGGDAFVVKHSLTDGSEICRRQMGTSAFDEFKAGLALANGGLIAVGSTQGSWQSGVTPRFNYGFTLYDGVIARINPDCTLANVLQPQGPNAYTMLEIYDIRADGNDYWMRMHYADAADPLATEIMERRSLSNDAVQSSVTASDNRTQLQAFERVGNTFYLLINSNIGNLPSVCSAYTANFTDVLVAMSVTGTGLWCRQLNAATSSTNFRTLAYNPQSQHVIVGGYSTVAFDSHATLGGSDAVAAIYDTTGQKLRTLQYGTSAYDALVGLAAVPDSNDFLLYTVSAGALLGQSASGLKDSYVVRASDEFEFR